MKAPKALSAVRRYGKNAISKGSQPLVLRTHLAHQNIMTPEEFCFFLKRKEKIKRTKFIMIIVIRMLSFRG